MNVRRSAVLAVVLTVLPVGCSEERFNGADATVGGVRDVGMTIDGGAEIDAGVVIDVGTTVDLGMAIDIGTAIDSGAVDVGEIIDAGVEDATIDAGLGCATPCSGDTPLCEETTGTCVACLSVADCDDADSCTNQACNAGRCDYSYAGGRAASRFGAA